MPHLENKFKNYLRQNAYRTATECPYGITRLIESNANYNRIRFDVHCAMVDLSKAYDRLNMS